MDKNKATQIIKDKLLEIATYFIGQVELEEIAGKIEVIIPPEIESLMKIIEKQIRNELH